MFICQVFQSSSCLINRQSHCLMSANLDELVNTWLGSAYNVSRVQAMISASALCVQKFSHCQSQNSQVSSRVLDEYSVLDVVGQQFWRLITLHLNWYTSMFFCCHNVLVERRGLAKVLSTKELRQPLTLAFQISSFGSSSDSWSSALTAKELLSWSYPSVHVYEPNINSLVTWNDNISPSASK